MALPSMWMILQVVYKMGEQCVVLRDVDRVEFPLACECNVSTSDTAHLEVSMVFLSPFPNSSQPPISQRHVLASSINALETVDQQRSCAHRLKLLESLRCFFSEKPAANPASFCWNMSLFYDLLGHSS